MECNFQQNTFSKTAFVQTGVVINSNYSHYFYSVQQIKKSFVQETYNLENPYNGLSFHNDFICMTFRFVPPIFSDFKQRGVLWMNTF